MKIDDKVRNREKNLTIHYDSVRKDLDIVLTSTIPTQKNLMKTILWVNASILAMELTQFSQLPYHEWLSVSMCFSFFAIYIIIYSLKKGQIKYFGEANIEDVESLKDDQFEHIRGLSLMMFTAKDALEKNLNIVQTRAKKLSYATTFTLLSLGVIAIYAVVVANIFMR
jgi:hypothetical protein